MKSLWARIMCVFQEFPLLELDEEEMSCGSILDMTEDEENLQTEIFWHKLIHFGTCLVLLVFPLLQSLSFHFCAIKLQRTLLSPWHHNEQ